MFTNVELGQIASALMLQRKSVQRLAAKEGQPEAVADEYRKVDAALAKLYDKVIQPINASVDLPLVKK